VEIVPFDAVSGNTTSCGCYQKEMASKNCKITGEKSRKYSPIISSARAVWSHYKDCDFETFYTLSQKQCFYCGREPHRTFNVAGSPSSTYNSINQISNGDFIYNGLDRIDSNKGHIINNVVPCCWDCNIAKNDQSLNDFFHLIKLIFNKHLAST
jgi:5-methylcytosine-specific restriction endonuclease McrA